MESFHLYCGRHNSAEIFKKCLLELTNHMVQNIDYGGDKLSTRIRKLHMVVIVVPDKVSDDVAAMTPVRQKIWLGDCTFPSK